MNKPEEKNMNLKVAIITINRGETNYLKQTLKSFHRLFPEETVYKIFDSGSENFDHIPEEELKNTEFSETKITLIENHERALEWASEGSEWAILIQDDVEISENLTYNDFIEWLEKSPKLANFISLWSPTIPPHIKPSPRFPKHVLCPDKIFWGALFLAFYSLKAKEYLSNPNRKRIGKNFDLSLRDWAKKIYINPDSLIQHLGEKSSIGHTTKRVDPKFVYTKKSFNTLPPVAIAITTFNDVEYTKKAIESLKNTKVPFYLYILDDDSRDVLTDELKEYCDIYYKAPKNRGLTNLWNEARAMAIKDKVKYLIISNNDVEFNDDTIDNMYNTMEELFSFNVCGPITNAPGHIKEQFPPEDKSVTPIKVKRVNGFCMMFRVQDMKEFSRNEKHKMFGAEDEYFDRVKPKTMVVRSAFVKHYKQITVEKYIPEKKSYDYQKIR